MIHKQPIGYRGHKKCIFNSGSKIISNINILNCFYKKKKKRLILTQIYECNTNIFGKKNNVNNTKYIKDPRRYCV